MATAIRILVSVAALSASAVLADLEERPDFSTSASIIRSPPLECEEKCDIRFPDGECKTNMTCLMSSLLFTHTTTSASMHSSASVHSFTLNEEHRQDEQKCQGKCLFTDKKDNCRLDLICALNRDVEGTLRFLMGFNVDAETAIQLALSATSNDPEDPDVAGKRCNKYVRPAPAPCNDPCEYRDEVGRCRVIPDCPIGLEIHRPEITVEEEEEEDDVNNRFVARKRVVVVRDNNCPGKCEVRGPDGNCIIDYDCANSEQ